MSRIAAREITEQAKIVHRLIYKGYKIAVHKDDNPINPLSKDRISHFVCMPNCAYRDYTLPKGIAQMVWDGVLKEGNAHYAFYAYAKDTSVHDANTLLDKGKQIADENHIVAMPLYIDKKGLLHMEKIEDTKYVGFVFSVMHEAISKGFLSASECTFLAETEMENFMIDDTYTLDEYMRGEVYMVVVETLSDEPVKVFRPYYGEGGMQDGIAHARKYIDSM